MPFDPNVELEDWQLVLLRAAQIVRERWMQGSYGYDGGPRCAAGAMFETVHDDDVCDKSYLALCQHLDQDVQDWNDAPGRTAEEVAAAMEACALEREGVA